MGWTVARRVFGPWRVEFVAAEAAVAVAIEGFEVLGGVSDLGGGKLTIAIGIEGYQQRWCLMGRVLGLVGGLSALSEESSRCSEE